MLVYVCADLSQYHSSQLTEVGNPDKQPPNFDSPLLDPVGGLSVRQCHLAVQLSDFRGKSVNQLLDRRTKIKPM